MVIPKAARAKIVIVFFIILYWLDVPISPEIPDEFANLFRCHISTLKVMLQSKQIVICLLGRIQLKEATYYGIL